MQFKVKVFIFAYTDYVVKYYDTISITTAQHMLWRHNNYWIILQYKVAMLCKPFHYQYFSLKVEERIIHKRQKWHSISSYLHLHNEQNSKYKSIDLFRKLVFFLFWLGRTCTTSCQSEHETIAPFTASEIGKTMEIKSSPLSREPWWFS